MTRPWTLRAALPQVWMREVSLRKKPSLSASRMQTRETSGISSPSRSRLIPTRTSKLPAAQVVDDLHALECFDIGMQIFGFDADLSEVFGQIFGEFFGERGDKDAAPFFRFLADLLRGSRRLVLSAGLTSISGSRSPVGRMICWTTSPWAS